MDNPSTSSSYSGGIKRGTGNEAYIKIAIGVILVLIAAITFLIIKNTFVSPDITPRTSLERDMLINKNLIKKKFSDARAHLGLGSVYMQMGDYTKAISEFNLAVKFDAKLAQGYYSIGVANEKLNRMPAAIKAFEEAIKTDKGKFEIAIFEIGKIYYNQNKYSKAKEYLNRSLAISSSSADTHYYLGLTYEKTGDKAKAISEFKEALKFIPSYKEAQEGLKRVSEKK